MHCLKPELNAKTKQVKTTTETNARDVSVATD